MKMDFAKLIAGMKSGLDAVQKFAPAMEGLAGFIPGAAPALKIAEAVASVGEGLLKAASDGQVILAAKDVDTVNQILGDLQIESDRIHAAIQA